VGVEPLRNYILTIIVIAAKFQVRSTRVSASNFSGGIDWDRIPNPAKLVKKIDQKLLVKDC
jgi:hypothetical protein